MNKKVNEQEILTLLKEMRDKALALYSHFRVGAVLVTRRGALYTGHNIESSSYGLTMCAERVAIFKALSDGEREFNRIYILAENNEFCPPCGACRQILNDYAPGIEVVLVKEDGQTRSINIETLLPEAFNQKQLLRRKK
jgi:cytidine deaminase